MGPSHWSTSDSIENWPKRVCKKIVVVLSTTISQEAMTMTIELEQQ